MNTDVKIITELGENGKRKAVLKYEVADTDTIKNKVVDLKVGFHTNPELKPQRYADGWFEVYITWENVEVFDGEEEFTEGEVYSTGGLWLDDTKTKVIDYDGVYVLNDKLLPLFNALAVNVDEVY
jgi:hypothetical protein